MRVHVEVHWRGRARVARLSTHLVAKKLLQRGLVDEVELVTNILVYRSIKGAQGAIERDAARTRIGRVFACNVSDVDEGEAGVKRGKLAIGGGYGHALHHGILAVQGQKVQNCL